MPGPRRRQSAGIGGLPAGIGRLANTFYRLARLAAAGAALQAAACASTGPSPSRSVEPKSQALSFERLRRPDAARMRGMEAPAYRARLIEEALIADARVARACPTGQEAALSIDAVRTYRVIGRDQALARLQSTDIALVAERVTVSGCNETRAQVLYPYTDGSGEAAFFAALPGESLASPGVQAAAVEQLVAQAAGVHLVGREIAGRQSDCEPMASTPWVVDTRIAAPLRDGAWTEEWALLVCSEPRALTIRFEETPTGVTFSTQIGLISDADR